MQTNGGAMMMPPDQGKLTMMEFAMLYYRQSPHKHGSNSDAQSNGTAARKSKSDRELAFG